MIARLDKLSSKNFGAKFGNSKNKNNQRIIIILIILTVLIILIALHGFLFDPYSVLHDQRNPIKELKLYDDLSFDYMFYRAPLYFIFFMFLNLFMSKIYIIKFLFLIVVPLFIVYTYKLSKVVYEKSGYKSYYFSALSTVVLLFFFREHLVAGYPRSLSFPFLIGIFYFTLIDKRLFILLNLVFVTLIYPPHFITGITFIAFYQFYMFFSQEKKKTQRKIFKDFVRFNFKSVMPFLLIFTLIYFIYYMALIIPSGRTEQTRQIAVEEKYDIDSETFKEINQTSADFIPSTDKYFGIFPKHYIDDIRMGIFGLIGGIKLWLILIALLFTLIIIRGRKFAFSHITSILFITSVLLYAFAIVFFKKLYLPNRYTLFTFPIIAIYLLGINLYPSTKTLIKNYYRIDKRFRYLFFFSALIASFILLFILDLKKIIYLGSMTSFVSPIFIKLIVTLFIFSLLALAFLNVRNINIRVHHKVLTLSFILFLILSIQNFYPMDSPVEIYDREIISYVGSKKNGISLCGYPEMMDSIHALTPNRVLVNLGQRRNHEDAYKLYEMLTSYYATSLTDVYDYMFSNNYDFFVIQKKYFHSDFTEDNNLFGFYPVLRNYEERLRRENYSKFVLSNPPREIIEFETQKSIIVSAEKLESYKNHPSNPLKR